MKQRYLVCSLLDLTPVLPGVGQAGRINRVIGISDRRTWLSIMEQLVRPFRAAAFSMALEADCFCGIDVTSRRRQMYGRSNAGHLVGGVCSFSRVSGSGESNHGMHGSQLSQSDSAPPSFSFSNDRGSRSSINNTTLTKRSGMGGLLDV